VPKTIKVVAGFLFFAALIAVTTGASLLVPGTILDRLWELNRTAFDAFTTRGLTQVFGALLISLGVACCMAAAGLLRRKKWAWWFAVVLFSINGAGDAVSLAIGTEVWKYLSGVAIATAFLFFLTRPAVRLYFGESSLG